HALIIFLHAPSLGAALIGHGRLWQPFDYVVIILDGIVWILEAAIGLAAKQERISAVGIDFQGAIEFLERLCEFTFGGKYVAAANVGICILLVQANGLVEVLHGTLVVPFASADLSAGNEGAIDLRIELDGFLQIGQRLGVVALVPEPGVAAGI